MNLNIKTKLAPNQEAELISVKAYTIFEVDGHKFFSHHPVVNKFDISFPDRWQCSEYFTGLSVTYIDFEYEDGAIEAVKIILTKRQAVLDNYIEKAIRQYGYANKED